MDILYLLIPMSVVLVAVIALVFLWAVKSGQFEDMEGPAHRILMDDDDMPNTGADEPARNRDKSIDINQADK
ncbi:MAG: cbb3-type cytochrome oxidase assembly protein CcoS [Thiobacillaceae bacterium]|jgi:cbb3-type cytochrome oxidase maturation protein|nr:cbb3-type cytochrome oxidase assembly protein CcoS [Thiobacillaceae bacterium]